MEAVVYLAKISPVATFGRTLGVYIPAALKLNELPPAEFVESQCKLEMELHLCTISVRFVTLRIVLNVLRVTQNFLPIFPSPDLCELLSQELHQTIFHLGLFITVLTEHYVPFPGIFIAQTRQTWLHDQPTMPSSAKISKTS